MPATKFTKGQSVVRSEGADTRYQVLTVHRDGSYTVRAMFHLNEDGTDSSGFLGFKYRVDGSALAPVPAKQPA